MNLQQEQIKDALKECGNTVCDSIIKVVEVYPLEKLSKKEIYDIVNRIREHLNSWKR